MQIKQLLIDIFELNQVTGVKQGSVNERQFLSDVLESFK